MLIFLLASLASADSPSHWDRVGMNENRPTMSYFERDRPSFIMTCSGMQTHIQTRGFVAVQQWPQPRMSVRFGEIERSANPDLSMIGDQTAFSFSFAINDSILATVRDGLPIKVIYDGKARSFPIPPVTLRNEFAAKCAALVPAGMRNN